MDTESPKYVLLFDGVCHFCNGTVNFIIERDPQEKFVFAPLQSAEGIALLEKHSLSFDQLDSLVLIKGERYWLRSTAALEIARNLKGPWPLLYVLVLIPPFIRNAIYNLIARYRYRWFGKAESCRIPTEGEKKRFL